VDGNLKAGSSDEGSSVTNISDVQRPSGSGEVTQLRQSAGSLPL
jgi:hypothetical protein